MTDHQPAFASSRREIDRNIETIRLTLAGRWAVRGAREDSLVALKAIRDEIERLRDKLDSALCHREAVEGLQEGTLSRD